MSDKKIIEALESQGLQNPNSKDIENFKQYLNEIAEKEAYQWAQMVNTVGATEWRNGKPHILTVEEIYNGNQGRMMKNVFLNRYEELYK